MIVLNESGHKLNVNNFIFVVDKIEDIKNLYHPNNKKIEIENLLLIKSFLIANKILCDKIENGFTNIYNTRKLTFSLLHNKLLKIRKYLRTLIVTDQNKNEIFNTIIILLSTRKAKEIDISKINTNDLYESYIYHCNLIRDLTKLLDILSNQANYIPSDSEIQILNLKIYLHEIQTINNLGKEFLDFLITIRKERNKVLYFQENNALELIGEINKYLKSVDNDTITGDVMLNKVKFKKCISYKRKNL